MTRDSFDFMQANARERSRFGDSDAAPATASTDLVTLDLALHHKTERALLVSRDGYESRAVWLPLVGYRPATFTYANRCITGTEKSGREIEFAVVTVTLRERLAKERGLI